MDYNNFDNMVEVANYPTFNNEFDTEYEERYIENETEYFNEYIESARNGLIDDTYYDEEDGKEYDFNNEKEHRDENNFGDRYADPNYIDDYDCFDYFDEANTVIIGDDDDEDDDTNEDDIDDDNAYGEYIETKRSRQWSYY